MHQEPVLGETKMNEEWVNYVSLWRSDASVKALHESSGNQTVPSSPLVRGLKTPQKDNLY